MLRTDNLADKILLHIGCHLNSVKVLLYKSMMLINELPKYKIYVMVILSTFYDIYYLCNVSIYYIIEIKLHYKRDDMP